MLTTWQSSHGYSTDLSARLHFCGPQPKWTSAAERQWPSLFDQLLSQYSEDQLDSCIQWAFNIDGFWPRQLIRVDRDPLDYFVSKIDDLMAKSIGHYKSVANQAAQQQPARPTAQQKTRSVMKWESAV